jgi:hypothetical protein
MRVTASSPDGGNGDLEAAFRQCRLDDRLDFLVILDDQDQRQLHDPAIPAQFA